MVQKTSLVAMVVGLLVASSFVGAAAFTSASIDRSANIDVQNDANGIIGLAANTNVGGIETSNEQLSLNLDQGVGLNPAGTFTYGDGSTSPVTEAFAVTNNDATDHSITLSYSATNDGDTTVDNVVFKVYDDSGSLVEEVSEAGDVDGDGDTSFNLPSGTTYNVVVVVDTTGQTSTNDLSGTLSIDA